LAVGPNSIFGYSYLEPNNQGYTHSFPTNLPIAGGGVGWTPKMHNGQGNVTLSDGSVQQVSTAGFRQLCNRSGDINVNLPNFLLFP
jgi:prepilin-type processing-associated H-X9-DG protein